MPVALYCVAPDGQKVVVAQTSMGKAAAGDVVLIRPWRGLPGKWQVLTMMPDRPAAERYIRSLVHPDGIVILDVHEDRKAVKPLSPEKLAARRAKLAQKKEASIQQAMERQGWTGKGP